MIISVLKSTKSVWLTLIAALAAAVASTLCCISPLLYLLFGISVAGCLAGVLSLYWLQLPMAILSLVLTGCGFWRLYLSSRPLCVSLINLRMLRGLFWLSVLLIVLLLAYPYMMPLLWEMTE